MIGPKAMQHGLIMNRQPGRTHVALIEGGHPKTLLTETDDNKGALGTIFMGRVVRVLPGMQAAFVNVSLRRTAFIHAADLVATALPTAGSHKTDVPNIDDLVAVGAPVVVQVRKEAMDDKGPRVTTHITLTGRYVVLLPKAGHLAISQRITDNDVREHFEGLLQPLVKLHGGLVVRTAALEAPIGAIEDEVRLLARTWQAILQDAASGKKPRLLYSAPTAAVQAVRELYQATMEGVLVNDETLRDAVAQEVSALAPHRAHTVALWQPAGSGLWGLVQGDVWRSHRVHEARLRGLKSRVELKGGGFLLIEQQAALTVVDVNSGTFVGQKSLEQTLVALNVAAAEAIARELQLRNIGGIVVIDFVDVATAKGTRAVNSAMAAAMEQDRAKHEILPMNRFGLVALTRRRLRPSLQETATAPCGHCRGAGVLMTPQEVCEAALSAVYAAAAKTPQKALMLQLHPDAVRVLETHFEASMATLEALMGLQVFVVAQSALHPARVELLSLDTPGSCQSFDVRDGF